MESWRYSENERRELWQRFRGTTQVKRLKLGIMMTLIILKKIILIRQRRFNQLYDRYITLKTIFSNGYSDWKVLPKNEEYSYERQSVVSRASLLLITDILKNITNDY